MSGRRAMIGLACALGLGALGITARAAEVPEGGILSAGAVPTVTVPAGGDTVVSVPVVVAEGFHVQANPASNEFLVPLELDLALVGPDSLVTWETGYPDPELWPLEGTDEEYLTYHGEFPVQVKVTASAAAAPGERIFEGVLRYQACDERRCFAPDSAEITFRLVVVAD